MSPYVRDLSADLLARSGELGAELADLIMSSDIRCRDETVVPTDDLVRSCRDKIELLLVALAGVKVPQTEGSREIGRRRAAQGMPLVTTLRGYRIGGGFSWNVLVRSADHSAASREGGEQRTAGQVSNPGPESAQAAGTPSCSSASSPATPSSSPPEGTKTDPGRSTLVQPPI
jgi:hypothetical protein